MHHRKGALIGFTYYAKDGICINYGDGFGVSRYYLDSTGYNYDYLLKGDIKPKIYEEVCRGISGGEQILDIDSIGIPIRFDFERIIRFACPLQKYTHTNKEVYTYNGKLKKNKDQYQKFPLISKYVSPFYYIFYPDYIRDAKKAIKTIRRKCINTQTNFKG